MLLYKPISLQDVMKALLLKVIICLVVCSSDIAVSFTTSPRVTLAFVMLLYLLYEWQIKRMRMGIKLLLESFHNEQRSTYRIVQENFELSRTVMNMSEQHLLMCEIRTGMLKTARYSKDVLVELRSVMCSKTSPQLQAWSKSPKTSPQSQPDSDNPPSPFPRKKVCSSPLGGIDMYSLAKDKFRRAVSMSETNLLPVHSKVKDKFRSTLSLSESSLMPS